MPQRVYANLPETQIKFCDYLFPDEMPDDSAERFRVLLEFDLTSEDVDSSAEQQPGTLSHHQPQIYFALDFSLLKFDRQLVR